MEIRDAQYMTALDESTAISSTSYGSVEVNATRGEMLSLTSCL